MRGDAEFRGEFKYLLTELQGLSESLDSLSVSGSIQNSTGGSRMWSFAEQAAE